MSTLGTPVRRIRLERQVLLLALAPLAVGALGWLIWRLGPWTPPRFDEYRMLAGGDMPAALALGPDGAVWFTIDNAAALGVLRNGRMQRVPKGRDNLEPLGLAVANDGSVWFTDPIAEAIGHLTHDGSVESFPLPTKLTQFGRLTIATDGAVWAADSWSNSLVRLQAGTFTPFVASTGGAAPFGMAADADGGIWSTLQSAHKLVHVDSAGQLTELEPPTRSSGPADIAVDRSGSVWFVEQRAGQIGRYANGSFSEFRLPRPQAGVTDLAIAPDGSVWFAELRAQRLGHLHVDGTIDEIALTRSDARPFGVRVDGAGNVWYTDLDGLARHATGLGDSRQQSGSAEARALAARLNELVVIFVSIVLQSLPFVLVGIFASAVVQESVSGRMVMRLMPRRPLPAIVLGSLGGLLVPVCDCGAIPLARRLIAKGLPVSAGLTFMLAAPVVNPIVLLATWLAFQGSLGVVVLRAVMTLSVAIGVGWLASVVRRAPEAARAVRVAERSRQRRRPACGRAQRVRGIVSLASAEFFDIFFFIALGGLATAVTQTFVPRADLAAFGSRPIASVLALMPAASVLSICSEADAFVARAFATSFSPGSVLAFMTIGQIVDLRNGVLLFRTLGARLVVLIVGVGYGLVLLEGLLLNAVLGSA